MEVVSGLKINLKKSKILVVDCVPELANYTRILSYEVESFPSMYLCLPLGASYRSKLIWNPEIERIEQKLSWKGNISLVEVNLRWLRVCFLVCQIISCLTLLSLIQLLRILKSSKGTFCSMMRKAIGNIIWWSGAVCKARSLFVEYPLPFLLLPLAKVVL